LRYGRRTFVRPPKDMRDSRHDLLRDPVHELHKWLYGEQGAAEGWAYWFEQALISIGWRRVHQSGGETVYLKEDCTLSLYVDDGAISAPSPSKAADELALITTKVSIKKPGRLHHFLGVYVKYAKWGTNNYILWEQKD